MEVESAEEQSDMPASCIVAEVEEVIRSAFVAVGRQLDSEQPDERLD